MKRKRIVISSLFVMLMVALFLMFGDHKVDRKLKLEAQRGKAIP